MSCDVQVQETGAPVAEIVSYIRHQFVLSGKVSAAKGLVMDCVIVAQNRSCLVSLDKGSYGRVHTHTHTHIVINLLVADNPFCKKDTREIFRKLFGEPDDQKTYLKVRPYITTRYHANQHLQLLCGLQVYIKFAGSVVVILRRWLEADSIDSDDDQAQADYLSVILRRRVWPKDLFGRREGEREVKELMADNGALGTATCALINAHHCTPINVHSVL